MLKPLEQFICDTCGGVIEQSDVWVEWLNDADAGKVSSFRIVHQKTSSPLAGAEGCYQHGHSYGRSDLALQSFLGSNGPAGLLRFIDRDPLSENYDGPYCSDLREWAELTKRLMVPYYEEGRLHIGQAVEDGLLDEGGLSAALGSGPLKEICERYSEH